MTDDSNSDLAQLQIDRQLRGQHGHSGGASIHEHRPAGPNGGWIWNIVGSLIVLALAFVANNLYQVNLTLAANAVSSQEMLRQLAEVRKDQDRNLAMDDRQEDHINAIDRRVIAVEQATGVQLRGGRRGN